MGRSRVLVFAALIGLIFAAAIRADVAIYYVDGGAGNDNANGLSLATAWKTIHKANQNLVAGDTVYIRGGTYEVGNLLGWAGADPSRQGINPKNSGTPGSPITYANYNGEDVQFVGTSTYCWAVKLFNGIQDNPIATDYIVVKGLHFRDFFKFLWILRSSHCEVAYCTFQKSRELVDWRGSTIYRNAQYNHIHHCTFSEYGHFQDLNDNGCLLEVGNESAGNDLTSYNLIESCHLYWGAHHVLGALGSYNVFRNNYIHNENWWDDGEGGKWGGRVLYMQASTTESSSGNKRNLLEGNRIAFGGETRETIDPNDYQYSGDGIKLASPYHIMRRNMLYMNIIEAVYFQSFFPGNTVYNHLYHNTFYHNGYSTNPKAGGVSSHAIVFNLNFNPVRPSYGNAIKNNIFYDDKNERNKSEPIIGHYYAGSVVFPPFPDPHINAIENNWKNQADPLFVYDYGPLAPFGALPDFRLRPASPCIDAGGVLTRVSSPSGAGTTFQVEDAGYFMDGWGMQAMGVQGDEIQLLGSSQRARITTVNYETHTITVDASLAWTQGQGVSLAYEGLAPDLGAFEYVPVAPGGFVPLPPCRVLDTRISSGAGAAAPILAARERRVFAVGGACGVPANAQAISGNLTVVSAQALGDLRVTGGHLASTLTSALSIPPARARANNALIQLATDSSATIAVTNDSAGSVHFILDVNGYFQ